MSTTPKDLFLIKVITTNICVNRMARGGEYKKAARGGKCKQLEGHIYRTSIASCIREHENGI
jgi:hypothetical protein